MPSFSSRALSGRNPGCRRVRLGGPPSCATTSNETMMAATHTPATDDRFSRFTRHTPRLILRPVKIRSVMACDGEVAGLAIDNQRSTGA